MGKPLRYERSRFCGVTGRCDMAGIYLTSSALLKDMGLAVVT